MKAEAKVNGIDLRLFLLFTLMLWPLHVLLFGWTLVKLWGWFVLPISASAPHLTILKAAGLSMIVAFYKESPRANREYDCTDIFRPGLQCLFTVGFGYLLHIWIVVHAAA